MKEVFNNIGADIIGELGEEGYLEGGDFFVAREDLSVNTFVSINFHSRAADISVNFINDRLV